MNSVEVKNKYQDINRGLDWLQRELAVYNTSEKIIDEIHIKYNSKMDLWEVSYTPNQPIFRKRSSDGV